MRVSCRCGDIEIDIAAKPVAEFFCHCDDCQAVHGAAYGMSPYLRVSTATDETSLAEGCRRIAKFCEGLH